MLWIVKYFALAILNCMFGIDEFVLDIQPLNIEKNER
jgi:hypothetical protein